MQTFTIMNKLILILILLVGSEFSFAQSSFTLDIEPYSIDGLPNLHSYAFGQYDGKWLIVGGRTSENQEESSYLNYDILVIDPVHQEFWKHPLEWVYAEIDEPDHLAACHSSAFQEGEYLYIAGGFGYSSVTEVMGTFPFVTILNVKEIIADVIKDNPIGDHIVQFENEAFAIADGHLSKVNNELFLAGGYFLDSEFSNGGDLIIQKDNLNKVSKFLLQQDNNKIEDILLIDQITYADYFNEDHAVMAAQIFPDGTSGLTLFYNEKSEQKILPNWMNVFDFGYASFSSSEASLPVYHSTVIPVYDKTNKKMHTVFLGGCDEYMCDSDLQYSPTLVEKGDEFIRTEEGGISFDSYELDAYLNKGKDAQFIINPTIGVNDLPIVDLSLIEDEKQLIGYIYGGRTAPSPMFYANGETVDAATNQLFKVYLNRKEMKNFLGVNFPNETNQKYSINIPYK